MSLFIAIILLCLFSAFILKLIFGAIGLAFKLVFFVVQVVFGILAWVLGGGLIAFLIAVGIVTLIGIPVIAMRR